MEMMIDHMVGNKPVTILGLSGELDASNFEKVIAKATELYQSGVRALLLDLGGVTFMSSSGLVALHSIALILRNEQPPDLESGWSVFHDMEHVLGSGLQANLKLLNPQARVVQTLKKTGMDRFFEIFTDRQVAVQSFQAG